MMNILKRWGPVLALALFACKLDAAELDTRQAINLTSAEKSWLLAGMRHDLAAIAAINSALSAGDIESARSTASSHGMAQLNEPGRPPNFRSKISPVWVTLATSMRKDFDGIAQGLSERVPLEQTMGRVGKLMQDCVACHELHRIVEIP